MAVPYTFGTATSSIPLSQLDSNFNTVITLGNTAIQLGNTVTTLNNMTLANVTISSGNVTITNVTITTANVTTANIGTAFVSGNVSFTGTGNRITGDFSNATLASRVAFQTSTVNSSTAIPVLPNGTSTNAQLQIYNNSDPTNGSFLQLAALASSVNIYSSIQGTGTYLPMTFYTGGSEAVRIGSGAASATDKGTVGIGYTALTGVGNNGLAVLGNVGIGTNTLRTNYSSGAQTPVFQIEKAGDVRASITRDTNDSSGAVIYFGKTRGTTVNSNTVVADGDNLGLLAFEGADGTNLIRAASISAQVDGAPGANDMPGRLLFSTTADGGTSATERMRIDASGNVGIGTNSPSSFAKFVVLQTSGSNAIQLATTTNGAGIYWNLTNAGGILDYSYGSYRISGTSDSQPYLFATNSAEKARLSASGDFLVTGTGTGGLGYGTGSGGTVTQATSKGTAVTLNKPTGRITTAADALSSNTTVAFTFTNSLIAATDNILFTFSDGNGYQYNVWAYNVLAGSCTVALRNITAGSLSQALPINFAIIKGATS